VTAVLIAKSIIAGSWTVLVVTWLVAARSRKPSAKRQNAAGRALHLGLLAVGGLLMSGVVRPFPLDLRILPARDAVIIGGAILCVLGLAVALWARQTIADNWSSTVSVRQAHALVVSGPYACVRHPIYAGLLLMMAGTALMLGRLHAFLGLLVCGVGLGIKIRHEEILMARHFPEYDGYRRRTSALLPFIF
jgi:protein-S-isoprenylcysteine O-methyltransferase Ste14